MPKHTITTIAGAKFDVSTGVATIGTEESEVRILHVYDGGDRIDIVMTSPVAEMLADHLRDDGIVTAKRLPGGS